MKDDILVTKLLAGDETAFRHLVKSYQSIMLKVARAIVGPSIAEEVVQETWLSVIKALPNFQQRSSLKTWILRIVSNCAKTRLRKESRNIAVGSAEDLAQMSIPTDRFAENGMWHAHPSLWHGETPDQILGSEQLKEVIVKEINKLPPLQQSVLILREIEGMEMEEICKILEVSASNSRVLLHRARIQLWNAIDQHESQTS